MARKLKICRVCGYNTRKNICPHCNCIVLIDKDNYDWKETSNAIDWSKIKN